MSWSSELQALGFPGFDKAVPTLKSLQKPATLRWVTKEAGPLLVSLRGF